MHLADLYRLQEIDRRSQSLTEQFAGLSATGESNILSERLARLRKELAEKKREIAHLEKDSRRCEMDAAGAAAKERELAERLYGGAISNLKELEKLEKMIGDCQKLKSDAEERELDLLLRAERLGSAVTALQAEAAALQTELFARESKYAAAAETLRAELSELPTQRREILARLDERTVGLYEALRQKKNGIAIVLVQKQTCGGCRIGLSTGTLQELRNPGKLVRCDNCGRILYWRGE